MAATLSALPLHSFTFRGFPPHKPGARRKFLNTDVENPYTLVYYESPYRLRAFLEDALAIFGDRQASVSNDLTKLFESTLRGSLSELVTMFASENIRGEYTVVIAGKPEK
jgi:16S rRNA (cytidine1402-2'-O)-methyltransferase